MIPRNVLGAIFEKGRFQDSVSVVALLLFPLQLAGTILVVLVFLLQLAATTAPGFFFYPRLLAPQYLRSF